MSVFKKINKGTKARSYLTDNGIVFDLTTQLTDKDTNSSFLLEQKITLQRNELKFLNRQKKYFSNHRIIKKTIKFYKTKTQKDSHSFFKIKPLENNNLPMIVPGNKIIIYIEKNLFKKNIKKILEIFSFLINKNRARFLKLNFKFKKAKKKLLEKTSKKSIILANWITLHQKAIKKTFLVSAVVCLASIISYSVASTAKNRYILALDNVLRQVELSEIAYQNNDSSKALEYLNQALSTTRNLDANLAHKKSELYNLYVFIQKKTAQIQNVMFIENPDVLIDFSVLKEKTELSSFVKTDNFFYTLDSYNKKIYKINIKEKILSEIKFDKLDREIKKIFAYKDKIIFFALKNTTPCLIVLNSSSNQWQVINFNLGDEKLLISDFAFYENQIYLLDTQNNVIWYSNLNDNNQVSEFKKIDIKKTGIENFQTITVDKQNIFLSDLNNNILKLNLNGEIQKLEIKDSVKNLNQISLIKKESGDNLIVLDSFSKKIFIFDNLEKITTQFTSPEFKNLKDIILDQEQEKIYVLTTDKILAL